MEGAADNDSALRLRACASLLCVHMMLILKSKYGTYDTRSNGKNFYEFTNANDCTSWTLVLVLPL